MMSGRIDASFIPFNSSFYAPLKPLNRLDGWTQQKPCHSRRKLTVRVHSLQVTRSESTASTLRWDVAVGGRSRSQSDIYQCIECRACYEVARSITIRQYCGPQYCTIKSSITQCRNAFLRCPIILRGGHRMCLFTKPALHI